jgi:hypothetical protein
MMRQTDEAGSTITRVFQVKGWMIMMTMLYHLVLTVAFVVGMRKDIDEHTRRIHDLETLPVVMRPEYADTRRVLEERLSRDENRLDILDNFQKIDQMQRPRPHR